jgi:hypothetical protein
MPITRNGRFRIDVRAGRRDSDGTFKPGRGLTLAVQYLPALTSGLADALQRARALLLIELATNSKDRTAAERLSRYRQRRNAGVTVAPA